MSDALQDSIREVNSIAEDLRTLQQRIQAYDQASKKLIVVSDHLAELCGHIKEMEQAFTQMATQAEQAQITIQQGTGVVNAMIAQIPQIVERIEKADMFSQVTAFNAHLAAVNHTLANQKQTLDVALNDLQQERQQQMQHLVSLLKKVENSEQGLEQLKQGMQQIHTHNIQQMQLLQLINQVSTQNIATPITQQAQILLEIKNLSSQHYQHDQTQNVITQKQLEDISKQLADLQKQFKHTQQQIDSQEQHLGLLSKRRGFIF